jgi:hypothetical protein
MGIIRLSGTGQLASLAPVSSIENGSIVSADLNLNGGPGEFAAVLLTETFTTCVVCGNGAGNRTAIGLRLDDVVLSIIDQATGADISADFENQVSLASDQIVQTGAALGGVIAQICVRRESATVFPIIT